MTADTIRRGKNLQVDSAPVSPSSGDMLRASSSQLVRKRQRPAELGAQSQGQVKFKEEVLYLVEKKMGSSRRTFLSSLARSKGFRVEDVLSDEVTHVVAENNRATGLWAWLKGHGLRDVSRMQVLDIAWFTESMKAGRPVTMEIRHHIQDTSPTLTDVLPPAVPPVSQYACQRKTTMENHNKIFTDAFEVLAESYEFSESQGRCLAFQRASSLLKSLPWRVDSLKATQGLPCLGEHTRAVIELFTSVFGVGPKTAEKWYRAGWRSFQEVLAQPDLHLNRMQRAGFLYYKDISRPVSKAEAQALGIIIEETVRGIASDSILALTGGFSRGKDYGHDVDFLLTTPDTDKEEGLLLNVMDRLKQKGILLYSDYQPSTFDMTKLPCRRFEAMDHFQKCFLILRLEAGQVDGGVQKDSGDTRGWRAVRVDLVAPPADRYAFALLGWRGSRQFERDLRRFARLERNMLLDNHALYDKTKKEFLPAKTEEDIFAHLGLEYIAPWQRNA
ncbi:DNA nucleotidylexotransferase isoform X2 [Hypomesus transpacificus]|uniref:DNA nucleotidylexotransferase isoform X2 n=1 Tax=Hypomesus transpacificus TaxID=137520 RepID=UPI001F07BF05|nr:DNA nucleotidylexotransferase isoform X2 [Hypomesus transpacificus]